MKYLCYFLLFICIACQENTSSRTMELYNKLDELSRLNKPKRTTDLKKDRILTDSIIKIAANLPSVEYSTIILKAVNYYSRHKQQDEATSYMQLLDSVTFTKINNKAIGFLLLREYIAARDLYDYKSVFTNFSLLASLLFDMENRQKLTPTERFYFLIIKARIYANTFKEYRAALLMISQAIELANQDNITGLSLQEAFIVLARISFKSNNQESVITVSQELLKFSEKDQTTQLDREALAYTLSCFYSQQQNYSQALYWLKKSRRAESDNFKSTVIQLYIDMDSIPAALSYLEKHRKSNITKQEYHTPTITWYEALVYQRAGDTTRYEHFLEKVIRLYDQERNIEGGIDAAAPIEAYVHLLWKKKKYNEAITRMEKITKRIFEPHMTYIFNKSYTPLTLKQFQVNLKRLQYLTAFYYQVGRPADALRQTQLYDSLQTIYNKNLSKSQQEKHTAQMYTAELQRNLDLKAAELLREQHKLHTIAFFLGITLLFLGTLLLLYHQRKKQIDILYERQKAIEQLQEEKQQTQSSVTSALSPEEELFRQLEKQFYDKQLFRNPEFSRDDLCRLGGSNRMYISTCINKYTGGNINQWINKARVDYAIRLIRSGETNLQVIAGSAGFSSTTSFFRNFKQFTQLTPKQYIQRAQ